VSFGAFWHENGGMEINALCAKKVGSAIYLIDFDF
jgi:hypothetical protein